MDITLSPTSLPTVSTSSLSTYTPTINTEDNLTKSPTVSLCRGLRGSDPTYKIKQLHHRISLQELLQQPFLTTSSPSIFPIVSPSVSKEPTSYPISLPFFMTSTSTLWRKYLCQIAKIHLLVYTIPSRKHVTTKGRNSFKCG